MFSRSLKHNLSLPALTQSLFQVFCKKSAVKSNHFQFINMFKSISTDSLSTDLNVFNVERSSGENILLKLNTPDTLNSAEFSGALAKDVVTISSIASPEPQIVTNESHSKEPTMPYGYGRQPIIPHSLNDLNPPMNPCNVMTLVSPAHRTETQRYPTQVDGSPIHSEMIDISVISRTIGVSTVDSRQISSEVGTFNSDEPRKISPASSPIPTPPAPRRQKSKLSMGMSSPNKKRECRSTPVDPPVNSCLEKKQSNTQNDNWTFMFNLVNTQKFCIYFTRKLIRIAYESQQYTDPDREETVTEQTRAHLVVHCKRRYVKINSSYNW